MSKRIKLDHKLLRRIEKKPIIFHKPKFSEFPNEVLLNILKFIPNQQLARIINTIPELFNHLCYYVYDYEYKDLVFDPSDFVNKLSVNKNAKHIGLPSFPIIITEFDSSINTCFYNINAEQRRFVVVNNRDLEPLNHTDLLAEFKKNTQIIIGLTLDITTIPDFTEITSPYKDFIFGIELKLEGIMNSNKHITKSKMNETIYEATKYMESLEKFKIIVDKRAQEIQRDIDCFELAPNITEVEQRIIYNERENNDRTNERDHDDRSNEL